MSRRKFRVLVIMHESLVPPDDITGVPEKEVAEYKSEYDVVTALQHLGHDVRKLGLYDEIVPLRKAIDEFRPHVVFNLLEEFRGLPVFDHNVVGYLELMNVPYTGNNPRGMVIARDKALAKKILHYHRIPTPRFAVYPKGRRVRVPKGLRFPLIVKSQTEEASAGIAQASVVSDEKALAERVGFIHARVGTAAIGEEYIDGRELYAGVIGNKRLEVLPIWELRFEGMGVGDHHVATYKVKWDLAYQERHGISIGAAKDLPEEIVQRIVTTTKRCFRALSLEGYARLDFRLSAAGRLHLLEANPNPDISRDEELASAAAAAGHAYEALIARVLRLGLARTHGP